MHKPGVFNYLRPFYAGECTSRTDLAHKMRMAPSKASAIVTEALRRNLLVERGLEQSRAGRRRVLLGVNPGLAPLLGIDIDRRQIRFVVTDFVGNLVECEELESDVSKGKAHVLELLRQGVERMLFRHPRVAAIGIGHSGVINQETGRVLFWPMVSGWENTPLKEIVEEEQKLPTFVEDNVHSVARLEQRFGQGKNLRNFVLVYVDMGIGSAIFTDGSLYTGRNGLAGEFGHATVEENGRLCSCGNRGCLELYSSASGIIMQVREEIEHGVASMLANEVHENQGQLTVENIVSAAQAQDRLAERVLTRAGAHLGTALAIVVNLLNPEKIILAGSVPRVAQQFVLAPLLYNLRHRGLAHSTEGLDVVVSKFGREAAAVGAVLLAGEEVLKARCGETGENTSSAPEWLSSENLHRIA